MNMIPYLHNVEGKYKKHLTMWCSIEVGHGWILMNISKCAHSYTRCLHTNGPIIKKHLQWYCIKRLNLSEMINDVEYHCIQELKYSSALRFTTLLYTKTHNKTQIFNVARLLGCNSQRIKLKWNRIAIYEKIKIKKWLGSHSYVKYYL